MERCLARRRFGRKQRNLGKRGDLTATPIDRQGISVGQLCLLKSPFLLRQLMLRPTMDTLLGDDVRAPVLPPDYANMGACARRAPARSPGVTAPTVGAAAHAATTVAAREGGPLALEPAFTHLDRMANGVRHRQA